MAGPFLLYPQCLLAHLEKLSLARPLSADPPDDLYGALLYVGTANPYLSQSIVGRFLSFRQSDPSEKSRPTEHHQKIESSSGTFFHVLSLKGTQYEKITDYSFRKLPANG